MGARRIWESRQGGARLIILYYGNNNMCHLFIICHLICHRGRGKLFSIKLTKKRRDGWAEPHLTFKKIFGYVICVMKESLFMIWTVYLWNENCICGMKSEFVGRKVNLWDEKKSEFVGRKVNLWDEKWIFGINCVFLEWKVESGKWI